MNSAVNYLILANCCSISKDIILVFVFLKLNVAFGFNHIRFSGIKTGDMTFKQI